MFKKTTDVKNVHSIRNIVLSNVSCFVIYTFLTTTHTFISLEIFLNGASHPLNGIVIPCVPVGVENRFGLGH